MKGSAVDGGNEADPLRESRNGTFAFPGEETLCVELLFEFFKCGLEFAFALKFDIDDAELVLAARFVNGEFAVDGDGLAVFEKGTVRGAGVRFEEDASELRVLILEREVNMARGLKAEVGDFAGDPCVADAGLECGADF